MPCRLDDELLLGLIVLGVAGVNAVLYKWLQRRWPFELPGFVYFSGWTSILVLELTLGVGLVIIGLGWIGEGIGCYT